MNALHGRLHITGQPALQAAWVALVPTVPCSGVQELRVWRALCKTRRQVCALASSGPRGHSTAPLAAAKQGNDLCDSQADSGEANSGK